MGRNLSAAWNAVWILSRQSLLWFAHHAQGGPIRVPPLRKIPALNLPPPRVRVVLLHPPLTLPSSVARSQETR